MSWRGTKSRPLGHRGSIQKHGGGWRAHFSNVVLCDDVQNIIGPLRESKKKAMADLNFIRDSTTVGEAAARAAALKAPAGVVSSSETLCLCGLNVQYPWSRLLMAGRKTMEVRKYALGKYRCFSAGEQLFLIETLGSGSTQGAMVDIAMAPAPLKAQVLGVIVFAGSIEFENYDHFDAHRSDTLIEQGSFYDWGTSEPQTLFGWYVQHVRAFKRPVPMGHIRKSLLGWTKPVKLLVDFKSRSPRPPVS
ncbi:unnamed protein product [Symbiodinium natans]|uniref:ASCH domain-containing protein n=1 Tax=Symbiodinium natans TaxID=878477 RepID=A0A812HT42_9DINO|nr:unnamed protein product [Symbiodinium natans]